jgi:hypothetical protein
MSRIFLFGDSFTHNIYEIDRTQKTLGINETITSRYFDLLSSQEIPNPLYFSDYLKEFGYDVYNYGNNGASILQIIDNFQLLKNFKFEEGDRIIVNLTSFCRFYWIDEKGEAHVALGENVGEWTNDPSVKMLFTDQRLNRINSLNRGYIGGTFLPFIKYFLDLHKEYKPIIWSPFPENVKHFENCKWFVRDISDPTFKSICPEYDRIRIDQETGGLIYDEHYSRYGNYYNAHIFKSVLESNLDGFYLLDRDLNYKIDQIVSSKPPFKPLEIIRGKDPIKELAGTSERIINQLRKLI